MFQTLVSRNSDIRRLVEKGYAVAFDSNYLVVRDIPYLNERGELFQGAIVTKLEFIDNEHVQQSDHQIWFAGGVPHDLTGASVRNLAGGPAQITLSPACADIKVERSFSNKPTKTGRYDDFFHKIESYVTQISGPAIERFGADPYTYRAVQDVVTDNIFRFHDTLTSRAEIGDLTARLNDDVVAVIGLGGTGAYVLDFMVKTPVQAIKAFDGDTFHVHNAYRSPGRVSDGEFGSKKADVYRSRYENFRHGLHMHTTYIDAESAEDLDGVTFAFVCVDNGEARARVIEVLIQRKIPFIVVGMGLSRKADPIRGQVRTTYFSVDNAEQRLSMGLVPLKTAADNEYRANIQIAELNAFNASLAVIRFKQLRGFYAQNNAPDHLVFELSSMKFFRTDEDTIQG